MPSSLTAAAEEGRGSAPPKAPAPAAPSRLSLAARPRSPARSASSAAAARSSRAATGYAAALADACARAGTLRRAARNARALLSRRHGDRASSEEDEELDARVAALVRMLVGKGKAGMVAEALTEFAAICDHLLPPPARHAY